MAGIGQRNSYDHTYSWNSAAQLGISKGVQNDAPKNSAVLQQPIEKRSLLSNASYSSLGGLGGNISLNYSARPSSSTRLKGLNSAVSTIRSNYNQESSMENIAVPLMSHGSSSNILGTLQRGISEPSQLTGMGCMSRCMSKPTFNGLNKNAVGMGLLCGSVNASSNFMNVVSSSAGLTFDPSDFPPIVNSLNPSQGQNFSGSSQYRNYVSAISKSGTIGASCLSGSSSTAPNQPSFSTSKIQASPEFSIDRDFPALPVAQTSIDSTAINAAGVSGIITCASSSANLSSLTSVIASMPSPSSHSLNTTSGQGLIKNQSVQRIQHYQSDSLPSGEANSGTSLQLLGDNYVTNIPKNMIDNQFGMIGLLKLIQIDPSFETLAPGLNLASLGIASWPPPGELHSVFTSPLTDQCMLRPHDMDYDVPPEYRIRNRIAGRLPADPPLELLTDGILFWIFYNCCREEVQLVAAKELYNREWRYHKKKMRWLTRVPGSDVIREGTSEQGTYYCWEPLASEKVIQQTSICYTDLDDTPTTFQLSSNTLNARVQTVSPLDHHQQQQHSFNGSSSAGGSTCLGPTGRIPRPLVTATKLPVISPILPNGPAIGVPQQMPVAKPKTKVNNSILSLAVAASNSVAAIASSNGTSSADVITTTTASSTSS